MSNPTKVLHMNRNVQLHSSDQKYVENIIRKRWPYTAKPLRIQYSTRGLTSLHKSKTQKQPHVPPTISSAVESCKQAAEGLATA